MGLLDVLGLKRPRSLPPAATAAGAAADDAQQPPPPDGDDVATADAQASPRDSAAPPVDEAAAKRQEAQDDKTTKALLKTFDVSFKRAEAAIAKQPVAKIKQRLEAELASLKTGREVAEFLKSDLAVKRMRELDTQASALALKAESQQSAATIAKQYLEQKVTTPFAALKAQFDAADAKAKAIYQPRFDQIKGRADACQPLLDEAKFDEMTKAAGATWLQIQALKTAISTHATEYPKYTALREKVVNMLTRMKGGGMLDADGLQGVTDLETAMSAADALGPIQGYAAAQVQLNAVVVKGKALRDNNEAYKSYTTQRDKVAKGIDALRAHTQKDRLSNELARLDKQLASADELAKKSDGGAMKALTALKAISADCAAAKVLADKLEAAAAKLPALTKKLEASGIPKDKVAETAQMSLKLLVEENCSEDDAVKMAKDASDYKSENMDEHDAMMSSRVKASLEKDGLAPDHAKSIGRNVRASGSATGDDAKALAQAMKGVSKKAIDSLNDSGIKSECCRGPITDAKPELAGVKPMGWPETATWDEVVGVYSGSTKSLVVGTVEEGGKRVVPGPGKGPNKPNPHGSSDLFGHEAGHAYDSADPGNKRANAAFITARDADKAAGSMKGRKTGGKDDYFLTEAEGGTNTKGAIGETFAESFAMHFGSTAKRWPELEKFWVANPWGV